MRDTLRHGTGPMRAGNPKRSPPGAVDCERRILEERFRDPSPTIRCWRFPPRSEPCNVQPGEARVGNIERKVEWSSELVS